MRREHALSREDRTVIMEEEAQEHCEREDRMKGRV